MDAQLEGKLPFVAFSGSSEYQDVNTGTYMKKKVYVMTTARCNVYRANIERQAGVNQLSDDFISAVNSLPLDDYAHYLEFLSVYGTHYVSLVIMGSKATVRTEFESSVWSQLNSETFDVNAEAEAFFSTISLRVSYLSNGRYSIVRLCSQAVSY